MRGYIDPSKRRMNAQTRDHHFQFAGQTANWLAYVSAVTGNRMMGYPDTLYYRESVITGMFYYGLVRANAQQQYAGGTYPEGAVMMTTRERLSDNDEVIYNGARYRVDANSQPSEMNGYWMTLLRRGTSGT